MSGRVNGLRMPAVRTWRTAIALSLGLLCVLLLPSCGGSDEDKGGVILVSTTPVEGALIKVGGKIYGESPCRVEGLSEGKVYVIASKAGYERGSQVVMVPEEGEVEVSIELDPTVGYLTIITDPPNAQVFLDANTLLGLTPLREKAVPIGDYTYEVRLDDYQLARKEIVVDVDRRYSFEHNLVPMLGKVFVTSQPTRGTIWINQQLKEETTPASFDLPPGTYIFGVYVDGFITSEQVVELAPNREENVSLALEKGYVPPGMVLIPPGEFIFGANEAPEERPRANVYLDGYFIDKTEVTNEEFQKVFPSHTFREGFEKFPATGVTWNQAHLYAQKVGKRLPTEMEWEKAARGIKGFVYPWGHNYDTNRFNGKKDVNSAPTEVGAFLDGASPFGCMDMAGNVYEWTQDWYGPYPGNETMNDKYGQVFRVLRGGSFLSDAYDIRSMARKFDTMDIGQPDYGFRCAADFVAADSN